MRVSILLIFAMFIITPIGAMEQVLKSEELKNNFFALLKQDNVTAARVSALLKPGQRLIL